MSAVESIDCQQHLTERRVSLVIVTPNTVIPPTQLSYRIKT